MPVNFDPCFNYNPKFYFVSNYNLYVSISSVMPPSLALSKNLMPYADMASNLSHVNVKLSILDVPDNRYQLKMNKI